MSMDVQLTFFAKDIKKYFYLAELLALVDLSLTVKMGVQYSLWGGSVLNLGTEKHRRKYFDAIDRFELPGCFCMTELRHGSNVAGLETEAGMCLAEDARILFCRILLRSCSTLSNLSSDVSWH